MKACGFHMKRLGFIEKQWLKRPGLKIYRCCHKTNHVLQAIFLMWISGTNSLAGDSPLNQTGIYRPPGGPQNHQTMGETDGRKYKKKNQKLEVRNRPKSGSQQVDFKGFPILRHSGLSWEPQNSMVLEHHVPHSKNIFGDPRFSVAHLLCLGCLHARLENWHRPSG